MKIMSDLKTWRNQVLSRCRFFSRMDIWRAYSHKACSTRHTLDWWTGKRVDHASAIENNIDTLNSNDTTAKIFFNCISGKPCAQRAA